MTIGKIEVRTVPTSTTPLDTEVVLQVTELTKRYGKHTAVDGLTFEVRRGEVFGFLGPNGAGKTTVISMILGLIRPHAGRVKILNHDVTAGDSAGLRQVGAIVESPAFYPYLSALDNLKVLAGVHGGVPTSRLAEVLSLVGLTKHATQRYSTFSLGMKQRLGLAGALLHNPALLIVDEPTNGLDPAGIVEMRALILRLAHDGHTIVLCSHLMAEVQQLCDRVMILANGRVVAQGDVETLLQQGAQTVLRVNDAVRAEQLLQQTAWIEAVTRDGDTLYLTIADEHHATLGQLLADHNLVVLEMRRHERDLEQYFLAITDSTKGENAA